MIFLYYNPLEPFINLIVIAIISYSIIGVWYMYKSGMTGEGSQFPVLCFLLVMLTLFLITYMLFGTPIVWNREYIIILSLAALWGLGNITLAFIIFLYIVQSKVQSKEKLLMGTKVQKLKAEIGRETSDSGLKFVAVIIIAGALLVYKFSVLIFNWALNGNLILLILYIIIASLILIGSIYSLYRKMHSTFGSIICIVGGFQNLFIVQFFIVGFSTMIMIPILLGCLPILGVILHHSGRKAGSILCISIGTVYLAGTFIALGLSGFFILSEPILLMSGGYILYQETLRK